MKPKPKSYDDDSFDPSPYIGGVGTYQRTTDKRQKVKDIKIIGFVRPKRNQKRTTK